MNCREQFGFQPRPGDPVGVFALQGLIEEHAVCSCLYFHLWILFLIEARAHRATPDTFFFMYKSEGLQLSRWSFRILTTDARQGFLTFSCQKTFCKTSHHSSVVVSSFSFPWLYFHYSWLLVLNLKMCLQPVYTDFRIIIFWGKEKYFLPHVTNVEFVLKCTEVNKTLKMYFIVQII